MIRPGEEVHFAALMNEKGETLVTIPFDQPVLCPQGAEGVEVNVKVDLTLRGRGSR